MAHRPIVQVLQQTADRGIEIGQVEEPPMAQPCQNPALDNQHRAFDLALVARLAAAGRQNRRVVVLGHGGKGLVERRLEPQRLDDPGLQIVADDRFGNPAEVRQGPGLAFDPIWQSLTEARHGEGQRRGPKHRDKYLRLTDLAGLRIDHLHRRAGIIGLHHRTRRVAVAEGRVRPALIGAKLLAEPGVAVAVGMRRPVFLPKQRQRHALALELLRHPRPLGLAQVLRRPPDPPEQGPLQRRLALVNRRQRPAQARFTRPQQVGGNRGLADLQPFRDRPNRQALLVRQPQDRS